jgi:uncharacterized membrane protein
VPTAAIAKAQPRALRSTPAACLVVLSLAFGSILACLTPPLRGPDETAHFVRAYGLSRGEIVPDSVDGEGRKGLWMPAAIHRDFAFFEQARVSEKKDGFSYAAVFAEFGRRPTPADADRAAVFVRYEGSEGYSPIAYLPHTVGAMAAGGLGLDFLSTFYLARLAGLIGATAVTALAVHLAGPLGWAFFAVAMLPSALYGRAVVSADAMTTATALMVAALLLRAARGRTDPPARRGLWLFLCVLSKPPNIVFALPELFRRGWPTWTTWAVLAPAVIGTFLWTSLSSADVAAWRLADIHNLDAAQFEPTVKIAAMMRDPTAFVSVLFGTLREFDVAEKWTQVVGVLGLFDTVLPRLAYPIVTVLMAFALFARLDIATAQRRRVALLSAATLVAYMLALAMIFYLVWTPIGSPTIWGLQGRYAVPALPLAAIALAGFVDRAPPPWLTAAFAIASALVGALASIAAVLQTDWALW